VPESAVSIEAAESGVQGLARHLLWSDWPAWPQSPAPAGGLRRLTIGWIISEMTVQCLAAVLHLQRPEPGGVALWSRIDRRTLLKAIAGSAALTAAFTPRLPAGSSDAIAAVAALFSDLRMAQCLGRLYLDGNPEDAKVGQLLSALFGDEDGGACTDNPEALRRHLAARRDADFANGRIAVVGGWILASTEARACALTAML
jgi:hypothetical protein